MEQLSDPLEKPDECPSRVGTSSRPVTRYHKPRLGDPRHILVPRHAKMLILKRCCTMSFVFSCNSGLRLES